MLCCGTAQTVSAWSLSGPKDARASQPPGPFGNVTAPPRDSLPTPVIAHVVPERNRDSRVVRSDQPPLCWFLTTVCYTVVVSTVCRYADTERTYPVRGRMARIGVSLCALLLALSVSIGSAATGDVERLTVDGYLTTSQAAALCETEFPGSTLIQKRSTVQYGLQTHVWCAV